MRRILQVIACVALLAGIPAQSQSAQDHEAKVQNELANLKMGSYGPVTPEQLAAASQPGQLIPFLETRFAHTEDGNAKASIATALVRLGDKDDTYWDFLVDRATPALESAAPSPRSAEYRAWAKAHNVTPGSTEEQALYDIWQKIIPLAFTGDPRSIPLLRKGLQSPNSDIQAEAAEGLARDHDKSSIPLIIAALNQASPMQARALAGSLKFFDDDNDPQIKAALEKYFPTIDPVEALKQDSNGSDDSEVKLPSDIERAVKAHAVQAVPILEQMFEERRNDTYNPLRNDTNISGQEKNDPSARHWAALNKAHIASALIRLRGKDDRYWNYLVEQANLVLNSDPPFPSNTDSQGKSLPSPEFDNWVKSHNLDPGLAAEDAMLVSPSYILLLAETGDPRAVPLLHRALLARNYLIQAYAASGLAKLQDRNSIPLIIQACKTDPPDASAAIAQSLLYFNDPKAQAAAEKYMTPEMLKAFRQSKTLPALP